MFSYNDKLYLLTSKKCNAMTKGYAPLIYRLLSNKQRLMSPLGTGLYGIQLFSISSFLCKKEPSTLTNQKKKNHQH